MLEVIGTVAAVITLAVVLYQLYESKRRVDIQFAEETRNIRGPGFEPVATFRVTNIGRTPLRFTGCWYDIARGERLIQFDSHTERAWDPAQGTWLTTPLAVGDHVTFLSLMQPLAQRLIAERYVFNATIRFVVEDDTGRRYGKSITISNLPAWAQGDNGDVRTSERPWWR